MLHVVFTREDPDCKQCRFSREYQQVHHVHAKHEPHNRAISITVPAKVHRRKLETSQHASSQSTSDSNDDSDLRNTPVPTARGDVSQNHRTATQEQQNGVQCAVRELRQRVERRRELCYWRWPERKILSQVKVSRDQNHKHRRLDRE
jgi:hypothetical protein